MSSFVAAVSILGGVALGLAILNWLAETVRRSGADEERAKRAAEDLETRVRQAEAMQKDTTDEDVARSLDDGSF